MKKEISLKSDYWPEGYIIPVVSKVHARIENIGKPIEKCQLHFRSLTVNDIPTYREYSKEWFSSPVPEEDFTNITDTDQRLYLGCFWNPPGFSDEILVGLVYTFIEKLSQLIDYISHDYGINQKLRKCSGVLSFCINKEDSQTLHIDTLGVIDEARRIGVASKLMAKALEIMEKTKGKFIAETLHVISTGEGTIKCYERNGFGHIFSIKDFYDVLDKKVEGRYYLKILT